MCAFAAIGDHVASKQPLVKLLDEDTYNDLDTQLTMELRNITRLYNAYIDCIHQSLQRKGVTTRDLSFKLLREPAFNNSEQNYTLLFGHEAELINAIDLQNVILILCKNYASFLTYDIFQFIVDNYKLDNGQEEFQYPDHLRTYIERHKISEFVAINPLLKNMTDT